ncbi:uncharacterized protein N0V89_001406 [Didymosphaeria variabile]|uniref:Uncharacterized protein n=1 Tax=Didymosphaeria variabile TaxID=1932322 RepID=A0A9W8XZ98_9PLEO|nr:uncharacterized protein N0V89_001406 [Didymosphaeria variabile]KAJ4360839.1 hypothetical protein N0V89_001406 [Didymosphaeria variabile]
MQRQLSFVIILALPGPGASNAFHHLFEHAHDWDQYESSTSTSLTLESSALMASTVAPIIPIQTTSYASTLVTATRAAAFSVSISTTSNFVLNPTGTSAARKPTSDSSSIVAFAIIVPLVALIAFISVIVFRMYRTRKEREEAAAAAAARAKTKAIEQQIYDMESLSENFDLEKYRTTSEVKELEGAKDIPIDIPIELEAEEPDKRRYHGL